MFEQSVATSLQVQVRIQKVETGRTDLENMALRCHAVV